MPALKHPTAGTVVVVEGDLEKRYRARGWVDAEKPKPKHRKPKEA